MSLFGGYFYCVFYLEVLCLYSEVISCVVLYSEVISIVSFIYYFYCVPYLEVISFIQKLFLLCPLFGSVPY